MTGGFLIGQLFQWVKRKKNREREDEFPEITIARLQVRGIAGFLARTEFYGIRCRVSLEVTTHPWKGRVDMLRMLTCMLILMMSACGGDSWGGRASVDRQGGPAPKSGDAKPGSPDEAAAPVFAVEAIRVGAEEVEFSTVTATIDDRTSPYEAGQPLSPDAFISFSPEN